MQDNTDQADPTRKYYNSTFQTDDDESFDAATFLYDLYKTCTVREIEQFKVLLREVQSDIL